MKNLHCAFSFTGGRPQSLDVDEMNQEFVRLLVSSDWSHKRAASELGVDPATVSRYCSGAVKPSITVLRLFAALIGERVQSDGSLHEAPHAPRQAHDAVESDLINAIRQIPSNIRRSFIDHAKALAALCVRASETPPPPTVSYSSSTRLTNPGGHAISVQETMPGVPPDTANRIREGALIAQRMAREMEAEELARQARAKGTTGGPSDGTSGAGTQSAGPSGPRSGGAVPAPASRPHTPPGPKGSAGTRGVADSSGSTSSPSAGSPRHRSR